jgi:type II secretory pathway component PulK
MLWITQPSLGAGRERGFALLTVLWVMVGVAALGLTVSLAGREAVATARNRVDLTRASWRAEDCLERARSAIAGALIQEMPLRPGGEPSVWATLDRVALTAPVVTAPGCELSVRPAGETLDLNAADEEVLRRLLAALRVPPARADSLVQALLDWRDPDDKARPNGAESSWYRSEHRHPPRNGPLADVRELSRVRGFETLDAAESVLGVEPGRVSLNHAPSAVLAALPGLTPEAVARIAERRARGLAIGDLLSLSGELSPAAREVLLARYPDLVRMTTPEPDAWIVRSRGQAGIPPITAWLEVRLVRAGSRAAVVRQRTGVL